jgi:hypothetical protein
MCSLSVSGGSPPKCRPTRPSGGHETGCPNNAPGKSLVDRHETPASGLVLALAVVARLRLRRAGLFSIEGFAKSRAFGCRALGARVGRRYYSLHVGTGWLPRAVAIGTRRAWR